MTATNDTAAAPLTLARGEYVTATPDKRFILAVDPREPGIRAYRWTVWQASCTTNHKAGYAATKRDALNDANVALQSLIADTTRGIA